MLADTHVFMPAGAVEYVVNLLMRQLLVAHAAHLGALEPVLAAAAARETQVDLLTASLSTQQLQQPSFQDRFSTDFELGTSKGQRMNTTVFRRNLESAVQNPACTVLADREDMLQLIEPLQERIVMHFSTVNCDTTWLNQVCDRLHYQLEVFSTPCSLHVAL
jgi:hypothetical protein